MTTTVAYTDVAGLAGTDLGYTDWLEITQEQRRTPSPTRPATTSGSTSTPSARRTARSAPRSRTDSSRCRSP